MLRIANTTVVGTLTGCILLRQRVYHLINYAPRTRTHSRGCCRFTRGVEGATRQRTSCTHVRQDPRSIGQWYRWERLSQLVRFGFGCGKEILFSLMIMVYSTQASVFSEEERPSSCQLSSGLIPDDDQSRKRSIFPRCIELGKGAGFGPGPGLTFLRDAYR